MKISKAWEKALEFLDSNKNKDKEKRDCMKELLHKLNKQEDRLKQALKDTGSDSKSRKLRKELNILQTQQEKAVKIIKGI